MLNCKNLFLFLFLSLGASFEARSASPLSQSTYLNTADNELYEKPKMNIAVSGNQYFSVPEGSTAFEQQYEIGGVYQRAGFYSAKVEATLGSFSRPNSFYAAVPEAYVGVKTEKASLNFGRQIQRYSYGDQHLHLGLYNPFFTHDYINYQDQGLFGIHGQAQYQLAGVKLSYLPVFIPNQGPQYFEDDGKIRATTRWANSPPSKFQFADKDREIVYDIRDYNVSDIVSNSGFALSTYLGSSSERPWIQASLARKPLNEMPLTRDTYATAADVVGQVKLSPVVTYTRVQSVDFNFDKGWFRSTLSYIEDRPENKTAIEKEALQYIEPLKVYSLWIAADLSKNLNRRFVAEASYSEIDDGGIRDLKADGSPDTFTFNQNRTIFRKPVTVRLNTDFYPSKDKALRTMVSWTYDEFYRGSVFSSAVSYPVLAQMNAHFGVDVLGVESQDYELTNYLQNNQAHDRVYGGLDYAF